MRSIFHQYHKTSFVVIQVSNLAPQYSFCSKAQLPIGTISGSCLDLLHHSSFLLLILVIKRLLRALESTVEPSSEHALTSARHLIMAGTASLVVLAATLLVGQVGEQARAGG
jgi:hypothetical protein